MNRTLLLLITLLAASAALGWRVGGSLGAGIFAGALCGGSLAALGASWQHHIIRVRPKHAMAASVEVFLVKLAFLLGSGLVFRFVPQAASRADWRSYLVAFAAGAFLIMIAGTFDNARALRDLKERRQSQPDGRRPEPRVLGDPTLGEGGTL